MKNKLNIGVDADGVLTNLSSFYQEKGTNFFKKAPVNENAYDISSMFGVSTKEELKFGLRYFLQYINKTEAREDAVEILTKLNEENVSLYEITARKYVTNYGPLGKYSRYAFENWLKKNNLKFDSIQYCSEDNTPLDKWMACSKLNIDVMIDDKPDVALFLANKGVQVFLFDAPYNQTIQHENIVRVYNWKEIYEQIQCIKSKMKENKDFRELSREEKQALSKEEQTNYIMQYRKYIRNLKINNEILYKNKRKFQLFYGLFKIPFSIAFHAHIEGKKNIPYQNGFLIASNHLNSYDQFYISKALGNRQMYGLASNTIKKTMRGRLCSFLDCAIYIDRDDTVSKQNGEKEMISKLVNDGVVLIFPEGTRKNKTEEGKKLSQLPFKLGAVSVAQKTGVAILPVSLYYGKEKYVKFGNIQFVNPADDLSKSNELLAQTILNMTMQSMQQDNCKKKKILKRDNRNER